MAAVAAEQPPAGDDDDEDDDRGEDRAIPLHAASTASTKGPMYHSHPLRSFTAARVSRSVSRRLIVSRLSCAFLPLARLIATFTRPSFRYIRTGTSVMPRSTVLPISLRISWRCSSSLRRRVGS